MSDDLAFSAEWLALREPADLAARSTALVEALGRALARAAGADRRLQVLELATGSGANIRALAPRLRMPQDWTAVDLDATLLGEVEARTCAWAAAGGWDATARGGRAVVRGPGIDLTVATERFDLRDLNDLDDSGGAKTRDAVSRFAGRALVTASALLDLLSERQVQALVRVCSRARQIMFFALTYDGRIAFSPSEPEDEAVRALVNRHQRTDKGFGAALGPDAAARTAGILTEAGYDVRTEPSDWALGSESVELQRRLLAGWAQAAAKIAPEQSATIADWLARRLRHVDRGRSGLAVGHRDLLASLARIE